MIGLVLVSHSALLAEGVRELAAQMAAGVSIAVAGGSDDGGIGTSLEKVTAALDSADDGNGVVVLFDLGSAQMTAEMALEVLDDERRERTVLSGAPLVEGALAAAVAAAGGGSLRDVEEALAALDSTVAQPEPSSAPAAILEVTPPNRLGLHARPAAMVVRALRELDADLRVTVASGGSASGRSLMGLVGLAAAGGTALRLTATGPDATAAVERIGGLIRDGFGETERDRDGGDWDGGDWDGGDWDGGDWDGGDRAGGDRAAPTASAGDDLVTGRPGAPGRAFGPASWLSPGEPQLPDSPAGDLAEQRRRLDRALAVAAGELAVLARGRGGDIFAAHQILLEDDELRQAVDGRLQSGVGVERAWWEATRAAADGLAALPDPAFAARAADVTDVGRRVLSALGVPEAPLTAPAGAVVLAADLTPSQVTALSAAGAAAAVLRGGAATAHATIVARGAGLPLVVGAGAGIDDVGDGEMLLVDGDRGTVQRDPDAATLERVARELEQQQDARREALVAAAQPVVLGDGSRVTVAANASTVAEAQAAVAAGAEGVGLLRTELLFVDRADLPSESEQVEALRAVFEVMGRRPVIVRTLDVGGDKRAPALDLDPVRNGFLGQRGLRLSLARRQLFAVQLRAILRAAAGYDVSVMFPFVTTVEEVRTARRLLADVAEALRRESVAFAEPREVGVMVEIPAAAVAAGTFVADVDFFSIGSNDLTQYVMAAERTIPEVAAFYRPEHPAVLELIAGVCRVAAAAGRWVGVCGEMAGDPALADRLVSLGVRELSMYPGAIPEVKARLRAAGGRDGQE